MSRRLRDWDPKMTEIQQRFRNKPPRTIFRGSNENGDLYQHEASLRRRAGDTPFGPERSYKPIIIELSPEHFAVCDDNGDHMHIARTVADAWTWYDRMFPRR